jgi:hypothetical protein
MNTPEVRSPEFPEHPIEYPADDALPETFVAVLAHLVGEYGEQFSRAVLAYDRHTADLPRGEAPLSDAEDQPRLPPTSVTWRGVAAEVEAQVQHVWLMQRVLGFYQGLGASERTACDALLQRCGWADLGDLRLERPPLRRGNRFFAAG